MKLLSFTTPGGGRTWGMLDGDNVADLGARRADLPDLKTAIASDAIRTLDLPAGAMDYRVDEIRFLPTVPNPDKILCVGLNYAAHAAETGREAPGAPSMFARFADTLVAHRDAMFIPEVSSQFDFEGELAVVIGRPGRYIPAADALGHVAGYTCFNDGSVRDYQKHSVTAGKNFPGTGALGPVLVVGDLDPAALMLETRLNGKVVQRVVTETLIHKVEEVIAFASQFTALTVGTVIATGTPEGVGSRRTPPLWLTGGDVVEVEISGIGTLVNMIEPEVVDR